MKPDERVRDVWIPIYQTQIGDGTFMVPVEDARCYECPVSLLSRHPEASDMVYQIQTAAMVKEATGAALYGHDTANWPEKWYEAVVIAEQEKRRVMWEQDEFAKKVRR